MKKIIIILSIALIFSCSSKKTFVKADSEGQDEIRKFSAGLNSSNWLIRLKTVKEISKHISMNNSDKDLTDEIILNFLIKTTSDSHETVVVESIKGLSVLRYPEAMERLSALALDEKNSNTRWYAILALSLFKNTANIAVFIKGLKSEDWLIREASIKGLLYLDKTLTDDYIPVIISAINDQNESVKTTTLQNLKIKNEKLYESIKKIFLDKKNESHINLLKATLLALEGYTLDEKVKEKAIECLTDRNSEIRILALRALKKDNELRKFAGINKKGSLNELLIKKPK